MSLLERAIDKLGPTSRSIARRPPVPAAAVAEVAAEPASPPRAILLADPTAASAAPPVRVATPPPVPPIEAAGPIDIDWPTLASRGFVPQDAAGSVIANEFRVIKRPLLANAFGRDRAGIEHGRRIMVTSAYPDEGKSFCAVNLALSIAAERDHRVLLVDADVARPSLPGVLDFEPGPGLIDLVLDPSIDPEHLVRRTSIDKLSILGSGRQHQHATELIASAATDRVLAALTDRFPDRVIIFDSPPVLLSTESRVLAGHMGQIVLVVAAGSTPRAAVADVLDAVQACPVVGVVFNKSRDVGTGVGYGYPYGYGYGYGYGAPKG